MAILQPDFSFKGGLTPDAILAAYQRKAQQEEQARQFNVQQNDQAWTQVAQAASGAISTIVQASKNKQRDDMIKTLSDSLASQTAPMGTASIFSNQAPGGMGPRNQTSMQVPISSYDPARADAVRAAVKLNPTAATTDYLKQFSQDPNAQLMAAQTKAATLQGKLYENQLKGAQLSEVPPTVKAMLANEGINVPDGMTVADLKTALPGIGAGVRAKVLGELAKARGDQVTATMSSNMGKDLNPANFPTGTPQGQAAQRLFASKDAKALFDQIRTQPDGPDRRQNLESALATVRTLVGGGNGQISEKMVAEMVPQSARKQFANWQEFFTNAPQGSQQQAFMDRLETTIDRVSGVNQGVVDDSLRQNISKYKVLHQRDSESWLANVQAAGLDPNDIVGDVYKPSSIRRLRNTSLGRQTVGVEQPTAPGGVQVDYNAIDAELKRRRAS